ncbi:unnamed protein product [Nyctereutes procyonoides]|uniref:(raccoon dog) hypothetical protein n=1 Tax=Nyctereutes procyonoides TaxID=34880 RepID=A0A811ZQC8_NYCPR|nr:unnamed protein product [Nyctereutes procyonoides]
MENQVTHQAEIARNLQEVKEEKETQGSEKEESYMVKSNWPGSQAQGHEEKWQPRLQMLIHLQDLLSTIYEANQRPRSRPGPVLIKKPFSGSWGTGEGTPQACTIRIPHVIYAEGPQVPEWEPWDTQPPKSSTFISCFLPFS